MAAIEAGAMAPDFAWPGTDGKKYSLKETLASGPALVAVFKASCPVCQMTFPFLERFGKHFGRVWGLSQDDAAATKDFARRYGVSFPMLLEDTDDYPTSNAYGVTNVPTLFLVDKSGEILTTSVGFSKQDIEDIAAKMGSLTGKKGFAPFHAGEDVPKYKPG